MIVGAGGGTVVIPDPFEILNIPGKTYVFYGGSLISESAAAADVILTDDASSNFGTSLVVSDFNADGKDDLVISAPQYNSSQGRTYHFFGGSLATKNASAADVILTGEAAGDQFGGALTAGDFNRDGLTDLAVGASGYTASTGRVYVFYGGHHAHP